MKEKERNERIGCFCLGTDSLGASPFQELWGVQVRVFHPLPEERAVRFRDKFLKDIMEKDSSAKGS